jgi:hypothetical protein
MEDDPDDAEAKRRGDHGIIGGGGMGAGMVHTVTEGGGDLQGQGNTANVNVRARRCGVRYVK